MRPRFLPLALSFAALIAGGCGADDGTQAGDDEVAVVRIALTNVPSNAQCVRFTVTSSGRTTQQSFTVVPNTPASLALTGMSTGSSSVIAEAFNLACTSVTAMSAPTWASAPVTTSLTAGETKSINVALVPAGRLNAALDFVFLTASPTSRNFGTVTLGSSSNSTTFTIRNVASLSTGALSVALSGSGASQFSLTTSMCTGAVLAAGATCTVGVRFVPTSAGDKTATLTIAGTPGGSVAIPLSGAGIAGAILSFSPTSHDFGSVRVGARSNTRSFVLTNSGTVDSGLLSVSLSGGAEYQLISNGCVTLPPGGSCTISLLFSPTSTGSKTATLTAVGSFSVRASATATGTGVL
jgi:hypothetical protein